MPLNIPNTLTWMRIALIPAFVAMFYLPEDWMRPVLRNEVAAIIFIVAAVTDWFDGFLARSLGQTSAFGAFLDPVADKLMVGAALILLVDLGRVDALIAIIIIGREITISALREWMAEMGARRSVAVSWLGKFKTAAQMAALPLLIYSGDIAGQSSAFWGEVLIIAAAVLTLWSMVYYLRRAWAALKAEKLA